MEKRTIKPEILRNREDLEPYSDYLTKYDWYAIDDLKDLKNKVNRKIFYLGEENLYIVVTGKNLKRTILKKMAKDKRFQVTQNEHKLDTGNGIS